MYLGALDTPGARVIPLRAAAVARFAIAHDQPHRTSQCVGTAETTLSHTSRSLRQRHRAHQRSVPCAAASPTIRPRVRSSTMVRARSGVVRERGMDQRFIQDQRLARQTASGHPVFAAESDTGRSLGR